MLMDNENSKSRRRISIYRVNADDQMMQRIEELFARFPDTWGTILESVYGGKIFEHWNHEHSLDCG